MSEPARSDLPLASLVLWGFAGALWTGWWGQYGPGMTADTMDYLGVGRAPFALYPDAFQWPPAFWLSLQVARGLGLDIWSAVIAVLCVARALLASGTFRLGYALAGRVGGHALALMTFLWVPLTYAGLYGLSEVLFLGAMVWWLSSAYLQWSGDRERDIRSAWRTTLWAMLMTSTRFVGLPMAMVELCVGAFGLRAVGDRAWWKRALVMSVCVVGPALAWAALGQALHGSGVGERYPSRHTLETHLQFAGTAWWDPIISGRYGDIFWGDQGVAAPSQWAQAVLFLAACALLWLALQPRQSGPRLWRVRMALCATLCFTVLLVSSTRIWLDPIGPRFMLPIVMLTLAAAWYPLRRIEESPWLTRGLVWLVVVWCVERVLAQSLQARFGTTVFALLAFGGAAACAGATYLDPQRKPWRSGVVPARILLVAILSAQAVWSASLLRRVRHGAMPSVQHPGWRQEAGVLALQEHVRPGDTIYTHTPETVRAILENPRGVSIEPFCFNRLSPDCDESLVEYLNIRDGSRREHAEWIVLLDRVAVPYLFLDELDQEVSVRPWVGVIRSESVYAYRWGPTVISASGEVEPQ